MPAHDDQDQAQLLPGGGRDARAGEARAIRMTTRSLDYSHVQDQVEEGDGGEKEASQGQGKGDGETQGSGSSMLKIHFSHFTFYVRKTRSGGSEGSPGSMRRNLKMTPSPLEMRIWSGPSG